MPVCRVYVEAIFSARENIQNFVIPKSKSPRHNPFITTLSIAKFTSEPDIVDQAMSHCPWLNVGDQSTFTRGSMNFEILSLVILVLCPLYPNIIPNTTTSIQNSISIHEITQGNNVTQ